MSLKLRLIEVEAICKDWITDLGYDNSKDCIRGIYRVLVFGDVYGCFPREVRTEIKVKVIERVKQKTNFGIKEGF